jgi:hypothetical protein
LWPSHPTIVDGQEVTLISWHMTISNRTFWCESDACTNVAGLLDTCLDYNGDAEYMAVAVGCEIRGEVKEDIVGDIALLRP